MLYNTKNLQRIEKILRAFLDNLILEIPLKLRIDRVKIIRVLVLAELKNAVLRETRLKV